MITLPWASKKIKGLRTVEHKKKNVIKGYSYNFKYLVEVQKRRCTYCGAFMSVKQGHLQKMALTKDHIFPASRTSSKKNNVVPCCRECNQKKADKEPTDYMLRRAKAAHIAACALMLADKHMDALVEYQLSAREHKITQRLQKEEHNVPEHLP